MKSLPCPFPNLSIVIVIILFGELLRNTSQSSDIVVLHRYFNGTFGQHSGYEEEISIFAGWNR